MTTAKVSSGQITVLEDPDALAEAVAAWLLARAVKSDRFVISLSGGSTPKRLYERLASPDYVQRFPWAKTHLFWGDERFVPADHPESNYRMTKLAMLDKAPIPEANIHRIMTDSGTPEAAAAAYDRTLRQFYGAERLDPARPLFDVTLLGLGPDGHTASLLPGEPVLDERNIWAAPVSHGRPEVRITLTYPPIESSAAIAFLVAGADKAKMLAHLRSGADDVPAGRLASAGEGWWFTDLAAASDT